MSILLTFQGFTYQVFFLYSKGILLDTCNFAFDYFFSVS